MALSLPYRVGMKLTKIINLLILAMLIAGCGTGTMATDDNLDLGSAQVAANVDDGAIDVELETLFSVSFGKELDTQTLVESRFFVVKVENVSDAIFTADVAGMEGMFCRPDDALDGDIYEESFATYAIEPYDDLDGSSNYVLCVLDGIKYADGSDVAETMIRFKTLDTTPPEITKTSPVNNATSVSVMTEIRVYFSEALNPDSILDDTMVVVDEYDEEIAGDIVYMSSGTTDSEARAFSVAFDESGKIKDASDSATGSWGTPYIIIFEPEEELNADETYTVELMGDIEDDKGNCLAESWGYDSDRCGDVLVRWEFSTSN